MAREKRTKPTFMKYIAFTNFMEDHQSGHIIIGESEKYRRNLGLSIVPICEMDVGTGETWGAGTVWSRPLRLQPGEIVAQASTFLGIVVRVERFRNQRAQEALNTSALHPPGSRAPGGFSPWNSLSI